jgi:signal peptidase I
LFALLTFFILSYAIVRKTLHAKKVVSIGIVGVAFIFNTVAATATSFTVRTYLVQAFVIPSSGMSPTLLVGDHLLANKLIYWFRAPVRGELVVFRYPPDPSKDFLQRVIATGGETIEIRDKKVFINGRPYPNDPGVSTEPDIQPGSQSSRDNIPSMTLPKDAVFVLGDNRDRSLDSRFWGYVPADQIVGRASMIYWSIDSVAKHIRTDRIGKCLR